MSAIAGILAGIAAEIGAPLIKRVLEQRFGRASGELVETVIKSVAEKAGAEPIELEQLATDKPSIVKDAVRDVEADMPQLIELYMAGLDGQFALLKAETREGFWQSFWRYGWMYLLAIFWIWRIVVAPVVNQRLGAAGATTIEMVDLATLMTLTSWFMALYMGGHTVKDLGRNVIDAVLGRGRS